VLISRKLSGKFVELKPFGALDLAALTAWISLRATTENDLNLVLRFKRPHECDLDAVELELDLFAEFAPERVFGLLVLFDEPPGNSPTGTGAEDVIEKQDAPAVVCDDRAGGDGKPRLTEADSPASESLRSETPQSPKQLLQHAKNNIEGKWER